MQTDIQPPAEPDIPPSGNGSFTYFLKGDISGIQEFIFNVKSDGAAKSLKGRSFFIQVLSLIGIRMVQDTVRKENVEVFYNGGGNFYLLLRAGDEAAIRSLQQDIDAVCSHQNFHLTFSLVSCQGKDLEKDFGQLWADLNQQSNQDKLKRFQSFPPAFAPYLSKPLEGWENFTAFLKRSKGYDIAPLSDDEMERNAISIGRDGVKLLGYHFKEGKKPYGHLVKELPLWDVELIHSLRSFIETEALRRLRQGEHENLRPKAGMIMEFSHLAGFAQLRTGTHKLGVLKMDVDSLGSIFSFLPAKSLAEKLSRQLITPFFGERLIQLLKQPMGLPTRQETPTTFGENIYTVFAGGDDCFFVGAWDVLLAWADVFQKAFEEEVSKPAQVALKGILEQGRPPELKEVTPLTISAGMLILDSTYPVVRFAELVEDDLKRAKAHTYFDEPKATKNKITILDEVLTWEEFREARRLGDQLVTIVQHPGESRALLEKIKSTYPELKPMYEQAKKGQRMSPPISKLFYLIRNSGKHKELTKEFMTPFARSLIGAFTRKDRVNPMAYPMAARLAEFSTRNKEVILNE